MNKRLVKCLKRVSQDKSLPDFGAVCELEELGYLKISGPSDDISIEITQKGKERMSSLCA